MSARTEKIFGIHGQANLPGAFFEEAEHHPDKTLLASKIDGKWVELSYGDVALKVRGLAGRLYDLGVKPGDKVFISAENRPEWAIADLAVMAIGAIVVPAFVTNTEDDHHFIMTHAEVVVGITSGGGLARTVASAGATVATLRTLILMDGEPTSITCGDKEVISWGDAIAAPMSKANVDANISALNEYDVCCFIYTSGTGGRPKGVMLTHRSIQANITAAIDLLAEGNVAEDQRFLSLLPLSHSYEHTAGMHLPIQTRSEVWYCESADQISNNLAEVSPTLMTAVPRLYEVLYDRITRGVRAKGGVSAKLFFKAVEIGTKIQKGEGLSLGEVLINPLLDLLVRRKVRQRLGGRLEYFISGGAALNPEIGQFFIALGINILQGYGQTEASPLISANRPGKVKIESVGPPVQGVEVRLSDDGEILVRGEMLMKGYWKDEAATRATIQDGWLHTGDIGEIDGEGFITITGRKKEMIVNSGGDNIAPGRVEAILQMEPEIEQVMVDGDKRPWLAAVIVPAPGVLENSSTPDQVKKILADAVERANRRLSRLETVRRFIVADEPFSVGNAQMTATLKTRRHVVREVYGDRLDALYGKTSK